MQGWLAGPGCNGGRFVYKHEQAVPHHRTRAVVDPTDRSVLLGTDSAAPQTSVVGDHHRRRRRREKQQQQQQHAFSSPPCVRHARPPDAWGKGKVDRRRYVLVRGSANFPTSLVSPSHAPTHASSAVDLCTLSAPTSYTIISNVRPSVRPKRSLRHVNSKCGSVVPQNPRRVESCRVYKRRS